MKMQLKFLKRFELFKFFFLMALFCLPVNNSQAQVSLSEQQMVLPTYKVAAPDKNPMFFKGETYQGASRFIYPYALNDVISGTKEDKAWKALVLENEYIKLCVTPEIGGKLYYAVDKTNDYNFIYKNNVMKPSNIGMTGAWVSGGIEWCVLHHHRASTLLPMDYDLKENQDGSKTIIIGETEPRQRMRWTIGITMFPGKSYYQAEIKILNNTPYTHSFLYWANVAVHASADYQVFFPPSTDYAVMHAKTYFAHWPFAKEVYAGKDFTKGVDISRWKNVLTSASFFCYDLKEDFMGGYDHGKESGTVHIGDHNIVKGAKLWEWGSGPVGQATEGKLTEKDGPYLEIMTGAFSDNQPDYSWIKPYEVKTFKQYWYPVKDIQGFKNANLNGAVNLEQRDGNTVFLGYYSTQKVPNAKIVLKRSGKVILEKTMEISPEVTFTQSVKLDGAYNIADLYTEMINTENGEKLISYQPVNKVYNEKLPETVSRPALPEKIEGIEDLYLTGNRIELFHNPRLNPMDYYMEALKRDPGDIRTNTAVGNTYLKNGDYVNARKYLVKAIKRLTRDYTRPSNCEPLYLEGLTLKALELYDEASDTLYRATWDYAFHSAAYLELARISCIHGDFTKALGQINESLSTNSTNNAAICLKASILRKLGDFKGAYATLSGIYQSDPLDFRAGNENYLIAKEAGDVKKAESELVILKKKMRDFDQNYLELAVGYLNDGLLNESDEILHRYNGKTPIVTYYMGYIQGKKGNKEAAQKLYKEGSDQSLDYVFPFRLETLKVLAEVLKFNPNDGKAYYYIGNILYDKQPDKAIENWEKAVKADPKLAIAYRNLGWSYYQHSADVPKAITAYEKAISLNRDEPMYYNELDNLYELSNAPIEKRSKLFEGSNDVVKRRDDSFVRQIAVLTLAGDPGKAIEYLGGKTFSYVEGSSKNREVVIDARLMLGKKLFAEKKYKEALESFKLANVADEEGGSEKPGNKLMQVNYYIGLANEALGNKADAKKFFTLCSNADMGEANYMGYYKGLSYLKLGKSAQATEIFKSLVASGTKQITQSPAASNDVFAKFGLADSENSRLSQAYLLRGIGHKGLGEKDQATADLKKAVELSTSNLWARAYVAE